MAAMTSNDSPRPVWWLCEDGEVAFTQRDTVTLFLYTGWTFRDVAQNHQPILRNRVLDVKDWLREGTGILTECGIIDEVFRPRHFHDAKGRLASSTATKYYQDRWLRRVHLLYQAMLATIITPGQDTLGLQQAYVSESTA
jgi:hypothetical protein